MLSDPNCDSPANADAAKMLRDNPKEFKKRVSRTVRKSQEELVRVSLGDRCGGVLLG
jgi:ubiquitin-conjugating enzyme E2 G1